MKTPRSAIAAIGLGLLAQACAEPDEPQTTSDTAILSVLGLCRAQPLVAERRYAPNLWLNGQTTLGVGLHFRIPESLPVTVGNSGNHPATLKFGADADHVVTCAYVGVGTGPAPTDPVEIAAANRYTFVACSDGSIPGAAVTAPYLHLRISSGGDYIRVGGRTVVRLDLREASPCCEGGDMPPSTDELCDSIDNDCDAIADEDAGGPWMIDGDGDGAGDPATGIASCAPVPGHILTGGDCNDTDPAIHPGAAEICNRADEDCDAVADEGVATRWFRDDDADRFGSDDSAVAACDAPPRHVAAGGDCDDDNDDVHPGAIEHCDGIDNDCDGGRDDGWFLDDDADLFGDPARPAGGACVLGRFVFNSGDCDDDNDDVHPFATETCDGVDQDCDARIDDNAVDAPQWYRDADGDGFGDPAASLMICGDAPAGYVADDDDCNDGDAAVHPGAADPGGDGNDSDCDGRDG